MKVLVCVKQVINPYVKVSPSSDHLSIKANTQRYSINPFDEIAVEETVRIQEQYGAETVVLGIGPMIIQESLRKCLALGIDRGILVNTDIDLCTLDISKIISKIVKEEGFDLVMMGKQSTDGDNSHTGQMVAGLLDWPQGTFISKLSIENEYIEVTREVDSGLERLKLSLPAIITTDLRLNEPRYPSVPSIIKAKKKELKIMEFQSLGIEPHANYKVVRYDEPPERKPGILLENIDELVEKLQLTSLVVK